MKSLNNLGEYPLSLSLFADEIIEFHASRLLLLVKVCGASGRIKGLTKMAKLDFFVRYPRFFSVISNVVFGNEDEGTADSIETYMVRYHYGPWDHRYYRVLLYLTSRELLDIYKEKKTVHLRLTSKGNELASKFEKDPQFISLVEHMKRVKNVVGKMGGSRLKQLIYETFDKQVTQLALGEMPATGKVVAINPRPELEGID